jgi:hypothetical protein
MYTIFFLLKKQKTFLEIIACSRQKFVPVRSTGQGPFTAAEDDAAILLYNVLQRVDNRLSFMAS